MRSPRRPFSMSSFILANLDHITLTAPFWRVINIIKRNDGARAAEAFAPSFFLLFFTLYKNAFPVDNSRNFVENPGITFFACAYNPWGIWVLVFHRVWIARLWIMWITQKGAKTPLNLDFHLFFVLFGTCFFGEIMRQYFQDWFFSRFGHLPAKTGKRRAMTGKKIRQNRKYKVFPFLSPVIPRTIPSENPGNTGLPPTFPRFHSPYYYYYI